jgi:hypothetical protein
MNEEVKMPVKCSPPRAMFMAECQSAAGECRVPDEIGRRKMAFSIKEKCGMLIERAGTMRYQDVRD